MKKRMETIIIDGVYHDVLTKELNEALYNVSDVLANSITDETTYLCFNESNGIIVGSKVTGEIYAEISRGILKENGYVVEKAKTVTDWLHIVLHYTLGLHEIEEDVKEYLE